MIKANVSDATNQTIIYGVGSGNLWTNGNCWYPTGCQANTAVDYYFILNSGSETTPTPTATPTPTPSPLPVLYSQTNGSNLSSNRSPRSKKITYITQSHHSGLSKISARQDSGYAALTRMTNA